MIRPWTVIRCGSPLWNRLDDFPGSKKAYVECMRLYDQSRNNGLLLAVHTDGWEVAQQFLLPLVLSLVFIRPLRHLLGLDKMLMKGAEIDA